MKRYLVHKNWSWLSLISLLLSGWLFVNDTKGTEGSMLPGPGDVLPPFTLPVPQIADDAAYLGLEKGSRFTPARLDVDLWVIEVLNVYCASCQFMRPTMNTLFAKIEADEQTKDRVKMLGVGAGNHQWDVRGTEKGYDFPILPDSDYAFHDLVGQPPTPFLIFARPHGQERLVVVASHLGRLEDDERLFQWVREGLNRDLSRMKTRSFVAPGKAQTMSDAAAVPLSESELLSNVHRSLTIDGRQAVQIKPLPLPGWDGIYTGRLEPSGKRVFASVVTRKIPCMDCHDVIYVYSFDADGRFLRFVPISIYKYGNESWEEAEIAMLEKRFQGRSLRSALPFSPAVDAISAATITTELIYDSIGDTRLLIDALTQKGLMSSGN